MEIAKSDIVRSDAGRDQGKLFVVLAVEGEYLLLAVSFAGHSRPTAGKSNRTRRDNVWQNPT